MATEIGQAYVQIMPSAKGISGSISKTLGGEATSAGKSAGNSIVGSIKKIIVAAGIGKVLAATITQGGELEQSIGGIETLFKDNADTVRKYANEAYKTVGVSANDYMKNVTSFSASLLQSMGGDTKKAAEVANMAMVDMGDNANKMGTDMGSIQQAYQGFAKQNYTMLDNLKLGYGGTKTEMQRLLKDATKLTGVKYDISNLGDVYSAINAIQQEIGITGTTALEASETIQGSFSAMRSAFTNVLGALAIGENLNGSLKALANTVSTFLFKNFIPMVFNILKALPGAIVTFIKATIPNIKSSFESLLKSIGGGFGENFINYLDGDGIYSAIVWTLEDTLATITKKLPSFLDKGGEIVGTLVNGIVKEIPFFMNGLAELIKTTTNFISENLPKFLEKGKEIILNIVDGILKSIPKLISAAGNIITDFIMFLMKNLPKILETGKELLLSLVDGIIKNLPAIGNSAVEVVGKFLDTIVKNYPEYLKKGWEIIGELVKGIWNNLPQIITTIGNLLIKLIGAIRQRLPEFLQKGIELIGKMALGIIQAIPGIVAKIPQVISAIVRVFGSLVGQFAGIGGDIIRGLWKGISSVQSWILGKIKGFVGSVTSGIKKFFGISSPSKVMANEVGKWLPAGLAEGIEDNTKPVSRAMEDLASLTTGTLESELAVNAISASSLSLNPNSTNIREEDKRLYDIIVRALADGTRIEWNDRELARLVRQFA